MKSSKTVGFVENYWQKIIDEMPNELFDYIERLVSLRRRREDQAWAKNNAPALSIKEHEEVLGGRTISAIKCYRDRIGCKLSQAREVVGLHKENIKFGSQKE